MPDSVNDGALLVLGFVSFALFFEHYDTSLLSSALKYIKDDPGVAETDLGCFQPPIGVRPLACWPLLLLLPETR